ncbi:n-acetyltransferase 5, putative [Ichthyophthirius multifiliis]|uniref:N-acetyltransferase 5, putative n=1 Tax=Ichthyophthirius multifiliis TaxID=5932 RepID=G0R4K1_ICHMU|nr:n-acetyltransferase 5, putative [Ichthyophthirius multifiliis]EGR27599.1 n-acetyltransferase 5, putative [Ichthyophthirius multifiliis]|eukprot:XP_004025051.1 n-acetyltransferase 5, putative [Ichthyophthirius multifiliis]
MATIRPFQLFDLLEYNNINLDILTETQNGTNIVQLLGKIEGDKDDCQKKTWHGHVTAITVAPDSRRQGIARFLMDYLEQVTEKYNGWFVDLFVRPSNNIAVGMYKALGYDIYQTVNKYYSSQNGKSEDGYDMRKSMKRDIQKITMKPTGKTIQPDQLEFN